MCKCRHADKSRIRGARDSALKPEDRGRAGFVTIKSTNAVAPSMASREVSYNERRQILPRHFGRHMLTVESAVDAFMRQLASRYRVATRYFRAIQRRFL